MEAFGAEFLVVDLYNNTIVKGTGRGGPPCTLRKSRYPKFSLVQLRHKCLFFYSTSFILLTLPITCTSAVATTTSRCAGPPAPHRQWQGLGLIVHYENDVSGRDTCYAGQLPPVIVETMQVQTQSTTWNTAEDRSCKMQHTHTHSYIRRYVYHVSSSPDVLGICNACYPSFLHDGSYSIVRVFRKPVMEHGEADNTRASAYWPHFCIFEQYSTQ